jgi:hypothetical protein
VIPGDGDEISIEDLSGEDRECVEIRGQTPYYGMVRVAQFRNTVSVPGFPCRACAPPGFRSRPCRGLTPNYPSAAGHLRGAMPSF